MNNTLGIYQLFGENIKSKKLFYEWCKKQTNLCEWDIERIENDLILPAIDNSSEYVYFSKGNILDFLEENKYYVGTRIRGKFKFVTCVYYKDGERVGYPIYSNSGVVSRIKSIELGIINAINDLEKKL